MDYVRIGLYRREGWANTIRPQIPPVYPIGTENEPFVKTSGRLFEIDGKVTYFAGTNAWWLGHLSKNEDVDKAMQQIADTKYKVVRVWGFGDVNELPTSETDEIHQVWYQLHNQTSGALINYGENGLQRLDYVVSTAERLGLKLVLPFINNWPDLGGFYAYGTAYGLSPVFYHNNASQEAYRDYIKVLVSRYRNSSAIFSWQLCNEPRCPGCDVSVIYEWATEISRYIKSLDPHHMVSMGDEGWFGYDSGYAEADGSSSIAYQANDGVDFVPNLNITTLDYGTFHLYPGLWGYPYKWGNLWIRQHEDAGKKLNKPVVLEEYGSPFRTDHATVEVPWQATVLNSSVAGDQVWQFGPVNLSIDAIQFGDEYSTYYDSSEYQRIARDHAQAMLEKKV